MKCNDIIKLLEELSPVQYACDWDNIGLMVGDKNTDIKKILVSLDGDDLAIDKGIQMGVDLIITHHPLIFSKLKNVTNEELTGRRIMKLIQNNICLYSMHTNFDVKGGMAQLSSDMIGLKACEILEIVSHGEGFGRLGTFEDLSIRQWADRVKQVFGIPNVCVYGDLNRIVSKVAISPGSGKDFIPVAIEKGAELLITGDINHHSGIDANALGLEIIDAGHYGIEHIFIKFMSEYLQSKLTNNNIQIIEMDKRIPFEIV